MLLRHTGETVSGPYFRDYPHMKVWCGQYCTWPHLPSQDFPGTHFTGWVDPGAFLVCGKKKKKSPCWYLNPLPPSNRSDNQGAIMTAVALIVRCDRHLFLDFGATSENTKHLIKGHHSKQGVDPSRYQGVPRSRIGSWPSTDFVASSDKRTALLFLACFQIKLCLALPSCGFC